MLRTLQFLLAAIVACALSAAGGAYVGWSKRGTQAALEQAAAVAKAEKQAREVSDHLAERIHQLDAERVAESENARKNNELYHAALRDRSVRPSIPVVAPACRADDPSAAGVDHQARAELHPEAAVALVRIVNDADDTVRKMNEVIDLYNEMRARINTLYGSQ
jgi:hypothetical protein